MGRVIFDISMSLDGYVTAAEVTAEEPMGTGGQRLHAWAFAQDSGRDRALLAEALGEVGVFVAGRRTYDLSVPWWGADGPSGAARLPVFVVTHEVPEQPAQDGVYTFVTDGVASTIERAQKVAGDRAIAIMSADIGRQCLDLGLVDEVSIHLVPILLGGGTRFLDRPDAGQIELEPHTAVKTPEATHLTFAVVGRSDGGSHLTPSA